MDDALRAFGEQFLYAQRAARTAWLEGDATTARRSFAALITLHEPYAAAVRNDLDLLCGMFMPIGFGMTLHVAAPRATPFDAWAITFSPLQLHLSWSNDMAGTDHGNGTVVIERVAIEQGEPRIVALFNEQTRERARFEVELVARALGTRKLP